MNFSWPLEQGLFLLFVWGCLHFLHNSQFNSTSGLGTLRNLKMKSYICSSGPLLGQTGYQIRLFGKRAGSQSPPAFGGPRSQAAPAPAPCPLFPPSPAWPVNSAALPFSRLPRLSRGSAGTGGRRPVAGQRPAKQHTLPPGPRHIRTSPSALRACGLISPPPLL